MTLMETVDDTLRTDGARARLAIEAEVVDFFLGVLTARFSLWTKLLLLLLTRENPS